MPLPQFISVKSIPTMHPLAVIPIVISDNWGEARQGGWVWEGIELQ